MACQSLWGMSHFNSKILHFKQCKKLKFLGQKEESTKNGKLWPLYGRFSTLTWRPGDTVQYLESPGLSGRVDSLAFRTNMKTIWYSMNTYPICVSPLSTSAHCRFAPLQNSCQNHCSHVWIDALSSMVFELVQKLYPIVLAWEMSAEISYWWRVSTQIRVVLLTGCAAREIWFNQPEAQPRSG